MAENAENKDTATRRPSGPPLLAPRREAVVDGAVVRFEWEPVEAADEYLLQVATDSAFEEVVFEQGVGTQTELTVENEFATDDRTYYWRVQARNEAGWSPGENIESFVSGTAEESAQHLALPEEVEEYGPAGSLIQAAGTEVAADVTGDEKYFEREREMGVAHEGVEAKQILTIVLVIILAIIGMITTLFTVVGSTAQWQQQAVVGLSGYPELQENQAQATQLLNQYDVVNDEEGVYRIPIDRAMDIMVNEYRQRPDREYTPELSVISEN